ncbi:MAG TPA: glucosaminidase domain-containing protein [Acidimicrobiia bacterium]
MPRRSRWPAAVTSLAVAVLTMVALASPTSAGPASAGPASAGDPVEQARARLEEAQAAAAAAADRYEGTLTERDRVDREITGLEARIVEIEREIVGVEKEVTLLRARRIALRELVEERAADLYRSGDPSDWLGAIDDGENAGRRRKLGESAIDADLAHVELLAATTEELEATRRDLDTQRADLDRRRNELDGRRAELDGLAAQLESQRADFERKVEEANAALEKAEALGAILASGTPVMGDAVLTAGDVAGWYRTTGSKARLADGLTIDDLAAIFIEEGAAEGVRGDVAFAQSYLETGGFSFPGGGQVSPDDNNFAGLGACDSCSTGRRFPTARDGVRAQIQHLRNYADGDSTAASLGNAPSPYWYGSDPATAAENFDTFYAKGWAPIWEMMGKGKWATDSGYAGKVLAIYERMGNYAVGV